MRVLDTSSRGDRPNVRLFTTGGTIASHRDPAHGAVAASSAGEDLLARVPEIASMATIGVEPIATVNGWNVTPDLMFDLAVRVNRALENPNVAAAIVTHGTDTVEETAFMVDLLVPSSKPVVFSVALRHLDELGTDGPRNLRDAVAVAIDPASAGRGALLVANQTVHGARTVTKVHTTNLDAFASFGHGPEGHVQGTNVSYHHPPKDRRCLDVGGIDSRVLLLKMASGVDDAILRWGIAAGYRGIVIEGTGSGNVPAPVMPGIEAALAAGIPVVLSTRVPGGPLTTTYGGGPAAGGGGHDLAGIGVMPAPGLSGQKARILLIAALGLSNDIDTVRNVFLDRCGGT